jgi:hypothetical protein
MAVGLFMNVTQEMEARGQTCGAIPPLPNPPPSRGDQLKESTGTTLPFTFTFAGKRTTAAFAWREQEQGNSVRTTEKR